MAKNKLLAKLRAQAQRERDSGVVQIPPMPKRSHVKGKAHVGTVQAVIDKRTKEGVSAHASYRTAAKKRERTHADKCVLDHYDKWDRHGLLARPETDEQRKRLVERRLSIDRYEFETRTLISMHTFAKPLTRAERVIAFIENYCYVPEGPRVGNRMVLDEFEKEFIRDVFDNSKGTQRAILSMAKKNGKTTLIAALVLVFTLGPEARANSQIVSGAMEREQAAIVFNHATKIINSSPALYPLAHIVASRKRFYGLARNVEFRALANVARSTHGISPVVAILDEIGQVKGPTSEFVDAITTAQGAYDDAILIIISTQAAENSDLLSILIDDAQESNDPHTVCHLYVAPEGCELMDQAAWQRANPALGTFRSKVDLKKLAEQARRLPSFEATFRNFNLNQRVDVNTTFVSRKVWEANGADYLEPMDGSVVTGGLDLSETTDLCSAEFVNEQTGDVYSFFWLPEKMIAEREHKDKQPYSQWVKQKKLFTTPGSTIEYEFIAEFLRGVFDRCTVKWINFDRYNMKHLLPWLVKAGFTVEELSRFKEFGQGFVSMSPAIRSLEGKLLNNKLRHGNHPVLNMCARHAVVTRDPAGNRKFNKSKATKRIDGMVALAMAVDQAPGDDQAATKEPQAFFL